MNYIVVDKSAVKQTIKKMEKYMFSQGKFYCLEVKAVKDNPDLCKIVASL